MDIHRRSNEKYGLQKEGKVHRIVKILMEYDNEQDATRDLTRLLAGEINDDDWHIWIKSDV